MTKSEFLAAAIAAAQESSARSGLPAGITVAQAALESNWGNSRLSREAHNYFGIKAHRTAPLKPNGGLSGPPEFVEMRTTEVVGGKTVRVAARFTRYESMAACFADRDRIIAALSCYAEARAHAGDPEAFTRALARHWATDPDYADKVLRIWRANGLEELDRGRNLPASA